MSGCSSQETSDWQGFGLNEYLGVTKDMSRIEVEEIHKNAKEGGSILYVKEAVADNHLLYILYDITFSGDIDTACGEDEEIIPRVVSLIDRNGEPIQANLRATEVIGIEGKCVTYVSCFGSWDKVKLQDSFSFSVGEYYKVNADGEQLLSKDVFTLDGISIKLCEYLTGDIIAQEGRLVGKVDISPLSLAVILEDTDRTISLEKDIRILCDGGDVLIPQGSLGESQEGKHFRGIMRFTEALNLESIKGIQISEYTLSF